jgi:hypothetical protein
LDSIWRAYRLDANAEIAIRQFIARVSVVVVRRAAIKLVALANLATNNQTKSHRAQRSRDPANRLQQMRLLATARVFAALDGCLWLHSVNYLIDRSRSFNRHAIVERLTSTVEPGKEPHASMIAQLAFDL